MSLAPIALFVYKRLNNTKQTIQALLDNKLVKESDLFIFSDAAKDPQSQTAVNEIRKYLDTISGFKTVKIIHREQNYGLAKSIISGVSDIVNRFNKVIVLEDDLVVSPYFLQFMNEGLDLYQQDEQVASIHGYALPVNKALPETYFLRGADCWGWATWQRAWNKFEPDGQILLAKLKASALIPEFDFYCSSHYAKMLADQIAGKNNSWAVRWYASAFVNHMYTLYPGKSLVRNVGMDSSGEHCITTNVMDVELSSMPVALKRIPIEKNQIAYDAYVDFFKKVRGTLAQRIFRKMIRLFKVFRPC
ncbi:MAG: glycosyltransferase family 2 protein [Candidatus Berkiellales bacterium]